ncbi:MAG: hypothetical protein WAL98_10100 [Desulfatiglandaceae bacterium]
MKTLGVILVSLIFIMGLSAYGANKSMSGHAKSKALAENLYPDNKPSQAHVQPSPADKMEKVDKKAVIQKVMKVQMPFIANEGQMGKDVRFYAKTFGGTVYVTKTREIIYSFQGIEPIVKQPQFHSRYQMYAFG